VNSKRTDGKKFINEELSVNSTISMQTRDNSTNQTLMVDSKTGVLSISNGDQTHEAGGQTSKRGPASAAANKSSNATKGKGKGKGKGPKEPKNALEMENEGAALFILTDHETGQS